MGGRVGWEGGRAFVRTRAASCCVTVATRQGGWVYRGLGHDGRNNEREAKVKPTGRRLSWAIRKDEGAVMVVCVSGLSSEVPGSRNPPSQFCLSGTMIPLIFWLIRRRLPLTVGTWVGGRARMFPSRSRSSRKLWMRRFWRLLALVGGVCSCLRQERISSAPGGRRALSKVKGFEMREPREGREERI